MAKSEVYSAENFSDLVQIAFEQKASLIGVGGDSIVGGQSVGGTQISVDAVLMADWIEDHLAEIKRANNQIIKWTPLSRQIIG